LSRKKKKNPTSLDPRLAPRSLLQNLQDLVPKPPKIASKPNKNRKEARGEMRGYLYPISQTLTQIHHTKTPKRFSTLG
jgi:hypothetical protein